VSSADFGIFLHIFRVLRAKIEIDTFADRPPPGARGGNHGANNAKEPSCGLWPKRPVGNRVPLRRVRAGTAEEQGDAEGLCVPKAPSSTATSPHAGMVDEECGFAASTASLRLYFPRQSLRETPRRSRATFCTNPQKTAPSPLRGATSPLLRNGEGLHGTRCISPIIATIAAQPEPPRRWRARRRRCGLDGPHPAPRPQRHR
jgi:hypothetical protein